LPSFAPLCVISSRRSDTLFHPGIGSASRRVGHTWRRWSPLRNKNSTNLAGWPSHQTERPPRALPALLPVGYRLPANPLNCGPWRNSPRPSGFAARGRPRKFSRGRTICSAAASGSSASRAPPN